MVTGGTGLAGRHAIRRLIADGYGVVAVVRDKEKLSRLMHENYSPDSLDIVQLESPESESVVDLRRLIEDKNITTIIHIAAIVGEQKISWDRYFEINVLWTKNLARAFLEARVNHSKFIFTSSVGVYGTIPKPVPADEDASYNPDGSYHASKVMAEEELLKLRVKSNLPLIILRPTILYGNGDTGFLFKAARLIARRRFPLSSKNPCIHLLDVEFLAEVYAKLVGLGGSTPSYIFNVADSEPVKMSEIIDDIAKSMVDAGYLRVPSFILALLTKLVTFDHRRSVSLKLISKSWFYNVDNLYRTLKFTPRNTIQSLDKKYTEWYKGAETVG